MATSGDRDLAIDRMLEELSQHRGMAIGAFGDGIQAYRAAP